MAINPKRTNDGVVELLPVEDVPVLLQKHRLSKFQL
jgi:hypothetical protein